MKLRIMQQGGGLIYTPFIPGAQGATTTSSKSSDSSEPKLDPLDKELISLMKDQSLLPSDIQQIYNRLIRFQKQTQSLSGLEGTDAYRSAMPGMLQILGMVNVAKANKAQSDEIVQRMAQENAAADVALDTYGQMYVISKEDGTMKKINPTEFSHEKYETLSNSQLLSMRQRQFGFQDGIMDDLRNMVGMSSVQEEIAKIISKIGTAETSTYITKNPKANEVLQMLITEGPEGIYKLSQKDRSEGLTAAWNAIYTQLPQNMRNLLRANAAIFNTDPKLMIQDIVLRNTSTKTDINYDASASKAAGYDTDPNKTAKEASEQLTQNNYLMQIGTKRLVKSKATIVPTAAQVSDTGALMVDVYNAGMPVDKNMKGIGMMTLSHFRTEAEASKAGDFSSVTFGNRILRPEEYDAVVYDGNSELNIAMLPYTYDPVTGQVVPNMALFAAFNYIQQILTENPNISQTELSQKAAERGFSLEQLGYDYRTNTMSLKDTMPFITFSAFASQDAINIPKTMRPFLEKLSNKQGKSIMQKYKTLVNYGQLNPSKNDRRMNDFNDAERWDFYKGNVYIPMSNAARALLLSGIGEYLPKSSMTDYAARVMARQEEVEAARMAQNDPAYDTIANLGQFR